MDWRVVFVISILIFIDTPLGTIDSLRIAHELIISAGAYLVQMVLIIAVPIIVNIV